MCVIWIPVLRMPTDEPLPRRKSSQFLRVPRNLRSLGEVNGIELGDASGRTGAVKGSRQRLIGMCVCVCVTE